MRTRQLNSLSRKATIVLSFTALLAVLSGYTHPLLTDEGVAAHIFQLSIAALVPTILIFLATADWKRPLRTILHMALPSSALAIAFVALFYLEHP